MTVERSIDPSVAEGIAKLDASQVKSVAIIGGGASGAITLDALIRENKFDKIKLFERRDNFGGVWCLDSEKIETPNHIIVSGSDHTVTDPPLQNPFNSQTNENQSYLLREKSKQERFETTASYEGITTNIIESMMTFSDWNRWDACGIDKIELSTYVGGTTVREYIDRYIQRNRDHEKVEISLNTTVEDIERFPSSQEEHKKIPYRFKLTTRQSVSEKYDLWSQEDFDAVVVATGHYHVPYIPHVEGLTELQKQFPQVVQHAKFYQNPEPYKDETVVIIGSRASGSDLTKQIANTANTVYQSLRTLHGKLSKKTNVILKPIIEKFQILDEKNFEVVFEDGSKISNPDHIIYGTGYQFSYPFLNRLFEKDQRKLTYGGIVVPDLYQHTFLSHEPLIGFVGVPVDGISFRVFEFQAVLLARFLAGKITLPNANEQKDWKNRRYEQKGKTRAYHTIGVDDALGFLSSLEQLGEVEGESVAYGRRFPTMSKEDVERYRKGAEYLREFWDEI